jgi:hypothetical protein
VQARAAPRPGHARDDALVDLLKPPCRTPSKMRTASSGEGIPASTAGGEFMGRESDHHRARVGPGRRAGRAPGRGRRGRRITRRSRRSSRELPGMPPAGPGGAVRAADVRAGPQAGGRHRAGDGERVMPPWPASTSFGGPVPGRARAGRRGGRDAPEWAGSRLPRGGPRGRAPAEGLRLGLAAGRAGPGPDDGRGVRAGASGDDDFRVFVLPTTSPPTAGSGRWTSSRAIAGWCITSSRASPGTGRDGRASSTRRTRSPATRRPAASATACR